MTDRPEVSVAIATRWGGADLRAALASARDEAARSGIAVEAVVAVDGGEADLRGVEAEFPGVRVVRASARAQGVGATCNASIEAARAPWVVLLNDDMTLAPGYLRATCEAAESGPRVFAVNPLARWRESGEVYSGRTGLTRRNGYPEILHHRAGGSGTALFASGGGLFLREAWLDLGGFDPIFRPYYWEDVDLSYRAWARGMEVRHAPEAGILHRASVSVARTAPPRDREAVAERNRWLFAWSCLSSREWTRLLHEGPAAAGRVPSEAAREGFARALLRAPAALRRRRELDAVRTRDDEEILAR